MHRLQFDGNVYQVYKPPDDLPGDLWVVDRFLVGGGWKVLSVSKDLTEAKRLAEEDLKSQLRRLAGRPSGPEAGDQGA